MAPTASALVIHELARMLDCKPSAIRLFHDLENEFGLDEIDVALLGLDLARLGTRWGRDPSTFPHCELTPDMTVAEVARVFAEWSGLVPPDEEDPPPTLRTVENRVSVF